MSSQVLSTCTVVGANPAGRIVKKIGCPARGAAQGEASVAWAVPSHARNVPAGRYSWQVVAGNAAGSILWATGTPGTAVRGTFVVTG